MISKILISTTIILIFIACSQTKTDDAVLLIEPEEKELAEIQIEKMIPIRQIKGDENSLIIKFNEFDLIIDSLEIWDEEKILNTIQKDTATVYLELGETIEGKKIKLIQKTEGIIKIYQRFENSITIMNEGPHCDLTEWKHYNSEWEKVTIKEGAFLTNSYTESDWQKFTEIDIIELIETVKERCGEEWAKLISNIKSPTEYPSGIGTSRIFLKFEFTDEETDKLLKRVISFNIPMGC